MNIFKKCYSYIIKFKKYLINMIIHIIIYNNLNETIVKLQIENLALKQTINKFNIQNPRYREVIHEELKCYKILVDNLYFEIDNLCNELKNYEIKMGYVINTLKNKFINNNPSILSLLKSKLLWNNNSIDNILIIKQHLVKKDKFSYYINEDGTKKIVRYMPCYEEKIKRSGDSYYNYKYIGYFDNTELF